MYFNNAQMRIALRQKAMTKNTLVKFVLAILLFVLATVGVVAIVVMSKKPQDGGGVVIILVVIFGIVVAVGVGIWLILSLVMADESDRAPVMVKQIVSRPKAVAKPHPSQIEAKPVSSPRRNIFATIWNFIYWDYLGEEDRFLVDTLSPSVCVWVLIIIALSICGCAAPQIAPVQMHQTIEGLMRMGEKRGEDRVFFFNRGETEYYCTYTAKPACLECRVYTRNDYRNGIIVHDDGADGVVDAGEVEEAGVKLDEFYRQRVWGGYVAEKGVEFESRYREVYGEIIRTLIRHLLKASPPDKPPEKKTATSVKRPKMAMVGKTNKR